MYDVLPGIICDNICVFIGLCFIIFSFGIEKLIGCNVILIYIQQVNIHMENQISFGIIQMQN
tara:strand:+ start:328 stop:513 length:186 start_codon:yes stop_codon:yes gene_type:complete